MHVHEDVVKSLSDFSLLTDCRNDARKRLNDGNVVDVMRSPTKTSNPKAPPTPKKPKGSPKPKLPKSVSPSRTARRPKVSDSPRRRSSSSNASPKPKSSPKTQGDTVHKSPSKGTKRARSSDPLRKSPKSPTIETGESAKKKVKSSESKVKKVKKPADNDSYAQTIEMVIAKYSADYERDGGSDIESPKYQECQKLKKEHSTDNIFGEPKKRGRPKGSLNKIRPDGTKKAKSKAKFASETDSSPEKPSPKKSTSENQKKTSKKFQKPKTVKRKKVISSKAVKPQRKTRLATAALKIKKAEEKLAKQKSQKSKKPQKSKTKTVRSSSEESTSPAKTKKSTPSKHKSTDDESEDNKYVNIKKNLINKYKESHKHEDDTKKVQKGTKKTTKKEYDSTQSSDDDMEVIKGPKKAFHYKWQKELKEKKSAEPQAARCRREQKKRSVSFLFNSSYFSDDETESVESDSDSESKPVKPKKTAKRLKKAMDTEPPRRTARMASLNARAMMHCMNEDARVPLSAPPKDSLALVPCRDRSVAIPRTYNSDDDSDSDSDSSKTKRKIAESKKSKPRRRRRGNELGVKMDMRDMVVTKRMASLNASAIMAASYSVESRSRRLPTSTSSENEVTDVDIKSKISYQAHKDAKSRSVITVQETTKKVKKAQGSRETEVEEHIIVKKKVKRQNEVKPIVESDREDDIVSDTSEMGADMLAKSPDSDMMTVSTITYFTAHTVTHPKTASGNCSVSADDETTVVQKVQKQAVTTTKSSTPSSTCTTVVPRSHEVPNTSHISGAVQKYSPINALSEMYPNNQHAPHPPIPYSHRHHLMAPPHGPYHPPPSHLPHQPYPPLAPHSPPYPPPSRPSSTSSASSPTPRSHAMPPKVSPCHPASMAHSPWEDRGGMMPPVRPAGCERHHSAFTAPTPSTHSPSSGHGYQPVSGPMPLGNPTTSSYKSQPPVTTTAPVSYAPASLMSSASHKPYKANDSYGYPPHGYPHYDKYLRQPPYQLYPSQYPGQYPEYNYHPPPHGPPPMHYSQEYSYTLCVPPPGGQQQPLALPPAPSSNGSTPPSFYHCSEYPQVFTYPPSGPPSNTVCCQPNPKNVQGGPLIADGKGSQRDKDKWSTYPYYGPPRHAPVPNNTPPVIKDVSTPVRPDQARVSDPILKVPPQPATDLSVRKDVIAEVPPANEQPVSVAESRPPISTWVVQTSASLPNSANGEVSASSPEKPEDTPAPEPIEPMKKAKSTPPEPPKESVKKKETKNSNHKSSRHLLCQPQPLSHVKTSSVLTKAKPLAKSKPIAKDCPITNGGSKNSLDRSSGVSSISNNSVEVMTGDRNTQPRKRGRPKKTSSDQSQFFRDDRPEERPIRRRMSLLASVEKDPIDSEVVDVSPSLDGDASLNVKREMQDTVKLENVSPKLHTELVNMQLKGDLESDEKHKVFLDSVKSDKTVSLKTEPSKRLHLLPTPKKVGRPSKKQKSKESSLLYFLISKDTENELDISSNDDEAKKKKKSKNVSFPPPSSTQFSRRRTLSGSPKSKPSKKQKYLHGWSWDGEPCEAKVWLRNDDSMVTRNCYKSMKHKQGDCIKVRDCVLLRSGTRKSDLPYVAKVAALWEDPENGEMMMSILWYYRPEHTEFGRRPEDLADEIFASKHRDYLSVACIEDRCYVLTFNEYCRYRRQLRLLQESAEPTSSPVPDGEQDYGRRGRQPNGCVVQDLLFFCRKIYDYRLKRILKNPWENGPTQ